MKRSRVTDVNVRLRGLNHTYPADIDIVLVAPNGSSATILSDVGAGDNVLGLTLTLDDEAQLALPVDSALQNGTYQPLNAETQPDLFPGLSTHSGDAGLSQLEGGNPNGEWRLYVVDDAGGGMGAFTGGWDLELTAKSRTKRGKR